MSSLLTLLKFSIRSMLRSRSYLLFAFLIPLLFLTGIGYILARNAATQSRIPLEALSATNLAFMMVYSFLSLGTTAANRIALSSLREQPYLFMFTRITPRTYVVALALQYGLLALVQATIIFVFGLPLLKLIGLTTLMINNIPYYIAAAILGGILGLSFSYLMALVLLLVKAPRSIGLIAVGVYMAIFIVMLMQVQNAISPDVSVWIPWVSLFVMTYLSLVSVSDPLKYIYFDMPLETIMIALTTTIVLIILADMILAYIFVRRKIAGKYKPEDILVRA